MTTRSGLPLSTRRREAPAPIVALEKRIAFDGAAAVTAAKALRPVVDAVHADAAHADVQPGSHAAAAVTHCSADFDAQAAARLIGSSTQDTAIGRSSQQDSLGAAGSVPANASGSRSVVFIESDVPDIKTLIANIDHSAQIVILDATKDGVDAIASYLAAHKGMKDVYILSHGSEAQLDLGTATLDQASMSGRYAQDLATIKASLAPDADILVYGCDFAKGADGLSAASLLSSLTGASVAASTNLTGGAAEGGDFVLEDHVGTIDAPEVLSSRISLEYDGLLAAQTTGAFTTTSGAASGTATSSATVATATTADGAVKVVVTVTPNSSNSANSITTTTTNATFDTTAPSGTYPTSANGASALEETLQFGGSATKGSTDGTNSATITIAYYDAKTGAAITVTNPIIYIDRIGGSGQNTGGTAVSNSSDLTITNSGATLTKLGASSSAFNVTSTDVYETPNTAVASGFSTDSNSDPTKGTSAGAVQVSGSYSTLTFNWAKAANSVNGGDRIDLIFSADTAMAQSGALPNKSYNDGQSVGTIATASGFSNPSGLSTTYSASGLPSGLSIDPNTGVISGTIDHDASKNAPTSTGSGATLDGTYSVVVTATNSANNSAQQTFTIDSSNQAPTTGTTTANQTNNDGDTIQTVDASKAFTDPNGDPLTYTATGLPAGLTISSAGLITGTVAKNATPGTYTVVVTGTDDKGAATTETFNWVVNDVPPAKTGTLANQTYNDGQAKISITTSSGFTDSNGNTLTYSATGLPKGLSIDPGTGQITGTIDHDASTNAPTKTGSGATLDGTYNVVVTASDGLGGSAQQAFTIDSKNQAPTVGTKTANQSNSDGDTITAVDASQAFTDPNGDPLTYTASGLPNGLTISSAGLITGTVAKNAMPGTYNVTVTGTDDKGAATNETFTWVVKDVPPTKNGTLPPQAYNDGQSGILITTSQGFSDSLGNTLTYSATGLPAGLSIDPGTGKITGTIDHDASKNAPTKSGSGATLDGTYNVVVTASDGLGGTASQGFTIDSKNQAPTVGTKTANQTNSDGDTITAVDVSKAFTDPNGDPLTYTASGLPSGLAISSAGLITGTVAKNAKPGTYSVIVTGTDDKGAAVTETFSWLVNDVPPAPNGTLANQAVTDGQSGVSIATAQGFTDSNGNTLTYSATGLPAGLSIDPTSGKITGTVNHDASSNAPTKSGSGASLDGTYNVVVTASDGLGGSAQQAFKIDSTNQAPNVGTKTANQTNSDGDTVTAVDASKAFTDPNGDPLTYTASGLPSGLAISSAGLITGTVAKNAAPGTYNVIVTGTDDKGAATSETFNWIINDVPPAKNGTLANQVVNDGQSGISFATSQAFSDSNGNRLTYSATGLPAGLSIDPATGAITGTVDHDASTNAPTKTGSGATLDGTYNVVVTAADGLGGTATQGFTIDSKNQAPTIGTKTADQSSRDGDTIMAVDASKAFTDSDGDPLTYTAAGLPSGLTISSAGLISGTVAKNAAPGTYAVTVTGTDDKGAATSETFNWVVNDAPPAAAGTLANQVYNDGQGGVSIATAQGFTDANGNTLTYSASGLPKGLAIDPNTGRITGTVDHDASKNAPATSGAGANLDGTYTVTVTATDPFGGTAQQSFTLDSKNQAPVVGTNTANQANKDGDTITLVDASKAFTDPNGDTLTYTASNLPKGLTIDPASGIISGTVAADAAPGTYAVRITATDDKGAATREALTWTVQDVPPTANGTLPNQTYADATGGISIATANGFNNPNGLPLTYGASGLPKGLSIDPSTGLVTGQLDHDASKNAPKTSGAGATLDGTYSVTITASDGQGGTAQQTFTIDATNTAPTLAAQTPDQSGANGQTVSLDASKAFADQNTGDTFTYGATGLPTGLSINAATGLIAGTIDKYASRTGPYTVSVTITDDKGAATTETFKWAVADVAPVATPALPDRSVNDGTSVTVTTAGGFTNPNNVPYTYTATGLPAGLSIDPNTGVISGTIDHDASIQGNGGTYTIAVTANDGSGGTATNSFHLTSSNQAPVVGTKTPGQENLDGDAITPVDTSKAFTDPNGDPLTYSASALPAGLVIDPTTGIISGTVSPSAAAGAYSVAITATDDKGSKTTETFGWTIGSVPPQPNGTIPNQAYADGSPGIFINTATSFSDRNNNTLTYSATGLPAGLSIDPATGKITGTLDHDASANAPVQNGSGASLDGTYTIVVTAADGIGGTAQQTFTLDATNQAPTIAKNTPTQTNTDGDVVSVNAGEAFADSNTGDIVTYTAGTLPAGLTIDPKTSVISGTLSNTDYTASPYTIAVTATDDKGAATTESFTWVVKQADPTVYSPIPNVASFDGAPISIETASHYSTDGSTIFTASGLPKGLTIDATTGVISGTIDHDASIGMGSTRSGQITDNVYSVTVTVTNTTNPAGTTQTFALDIANQAPVVGAVTPNQSNKDGDMVATVDASTTFSDPNGDPLTYSASNLPAGLTIDNTGKITGTVANNAYPGDYKVTITAADDKGAATSEVFTWTVADVPPTATGTLAGQTAPDGSTGISIATAGGFADSNNNPLYYGATGLPPGLTIDPRSGTISGAIDHDASKNGPYHITVTAYDGLGGSAVQTFDFTATNTAPAVAAQTPDQHGQDGQTVSLAAGPAFSDANGDPLTYTATNLPTGLSIDPVTGAITGTIDKGASKAGPYAVTVTATDDKGAATTESFRWVVDNLAPTATPPLADRSVNDGTGVSYATAGGFTNPNGLTLTYSATGLPKGLVIDQATGMISGTLDHDASAAVSGGVYTVAVTVNDGQDGTATNTFHLVASNQAPAVTAPIADRSNQDGDTVTPIDASKVFADPNPGDTVVYSASNLPKGLTIDPTSGLISGTVAADAAPGAYYVTVTATDDKGAATPATFTWGIGDVPPTAQGTLAAQHVSDSQIGISIPTAGGFDSPNGLPLTYSASGLPKGLTIDPSTGIISGFINHDASKNAPVTSGSGATLDGTYTIVVTASDGQGGTAQQSFALDSKNQAPALGMPTADQHSADGQAITLPAGQAFADPNTGDVVTYTASGLPKGLAIDPATGTITGTIDPRASTSAPYTVVVTATDDKGAATSETFHWAVDDVPPAAGTPIAAASAPDGTTITPIDTASSFSSPNGLPLTYTAAGLPAGLSIDPVTGRIGGTLDHDASKNAPVTTGSGTTLDGTYTIVVTASDGQGGTAQQSFTFDATNQAPVIGMPTADQHSADGQAITLPAGQAFADPNTGDVVTYTASGLPKGLAIDPATGAITGTIDPRASASAPYTIVVTATDDKGAATSETFHWAVDDVPPKAGAPIAPANSPDGTTIAPIDTASSFSNPNGLPLTYTAAGLPAGLAIDPATGRISGTLDHDASKNAPVTTGSGGTLDGTYTIVVTASDGQGGTAQQSFTFDATNQAPAIAKSTPDQHNADGQVVSVPAGQAFADPNTGDIVTYTASGLPKGLTIDPATGTISGTIDPRASSSAPYTVVVTATDDKGAATSETFHWAVDDVPPSAGNPIAPVSAADGQPITPIDTAPSFSNPNGLPLTYTAAGLPAGLSIDPVTGRIGGTLDHDASKSGPYTITVTASDGQGGSAQQSFTLNASNQPPALTNQTADQHSADGQTVSVAAGQAFADPNSGDAVTYAVSGLPAGLSIDPASGTISGTIAGDARPGVYKVTVVATDDKGASTSETFAWTVDDVPPTTASRLPDQHYLDGQQGVALSTADGFASPNGQPLSYEASGLPKGLSIDPATGRITGSLDPNASAMAPVKMGSGGNLEGIYVVTVTATDANGGSTSQIFAIAVDNVGPALAKQTPDQHARPGDTPAPLDVGSAFSDGTGDTLTYAAKGLPPGLTLDPATGLVSGTLDRSSASSGAYTVTITATDGKGASASETFVYDVEAVPPNILRQPSAAIPVAALLPNQGTYDVFVPHGLDVQPATPVLDAINKISGTTEGSQVIKEDGIVVSTVNGVAPLNGLQKLSRVDGIVRTGAGTNERGDLIEKTQEGIGRGVEALSTPSTFFGATSVDVDAMARRDGTPGFNIETTLHDRVLAIGIGSIAGDRDPLVRVTVTRVDGSPLPPWLHVEGKGYIVGKVPGGIDRIDLRITTTFASGAHSERAVTIRTDRGTILPLAQRPHAARTLATMVAAAGSREATFGGIGDLL